MSLPMMKPPRKNPVLRTPQMNLPPSARGRVALGLAAAAAERQRQAEALIQQDPLVQAMQRDGGGKIVPGSIPPM